MFAKVFAISNLYILTLLSSIILIEIFTKDF